MPQHPFPAPGMPADVATVFARWSDDQRKSALALRDLVLETAARHPEIGALRECLKWGEPAYLPRKAGIGSTVRIAPMRDSGDIALFFICTSGLMDEFRTLYPDRFAYRGDRAIALPDGPGAMREEIAHVIALALTSRLRRRLNG